MVCQEKKEWFVMPPAAIAAILVLAVFAVAGALVKWVLRRKLKDIDGLGKIQSGDRDDPVIGLGDDDPK